jgi:hypothetical protein
LEQREYLTQDLHFAVVLQLYLVLLQSQEELDFQTNLEFEGRLLAWGNNPNHRIDYQKKVIGFLSQRLVSQPFAPQHC